MATESVPPAEQGSSPSPRRARTRQRLIEAATKVFARHGVMAATVEQIVEEAHFTRGAFYSNFADKDELVAAVVVTSTDGILEAVDKATEGASATSNSDELVESFLSTQPATAAQYLIMNELSLLAIRSPDEAFGYRESMRAFEQRVGALLSDRMRALGLEPIIGQADLLECLSGVFERSIRAALMEGRHEDELLDQARRVLPVLIRQLTRPLPEVPAPR